MTLLGRLQRGLETTYRVDTHLDVDAFIVDEGERERAAGPDERRPREQLLLRQDGGELSLGLFLDGGVIANLEQHDPSAGLTETNFGDFCLAVEGVSHFVYVAHRAAHDRSVSALEMELQAEVDKFVSCALLREDADDHAGVGASELRRRLFDDVHYHDDLRGPERDRYRVANDEARRYAGSIERRFLRDPRVPDLLAELRRFYRLGLEDKLAHIAHAA